MMMMISVYGIVQKKGCNGRSELYKLFGWNCPI